MKVALAGTGMWGAVIHEKLSKSNQVDEIFCLRRTSTSLIKIDEDISCIRDEDLEGRGVEAVFLAVPIRALFQAAFYYLQRGFHVFAEKPCCQSQKELDKLLAISQEQGSVFQIGYQHIFDERNQDIKESIGNTQDFTVNHVWLKETTSRDRTHMNLLCHEIARFSSILGERKIDVQDIECRNLMNGVEGKFQVDLNDQSATFNFHINDKSKIAHRFVSYDDLILMPDQQDVVDKEIQHFLGSIKGFVNPISHRVFQNTQLILDKIGSSIH